MRENYPSSCPYLVAEGALASRFAFFLCTLLLPDCPEPLLLKAREAGLEPVALDPARDGPVIAVYRSALLTQCSKCPERGWCPWLAKLRSTQSA